jgi:hypothetical protein
MFIGKKKNIFISNIYMNRKDKNHLIIIVDIDFSREEKYVSFKNSIVIMFVFSVNILYLFLAYILTVGDST